MLCVQSYCHMTMVHKRKLYACVLVLCVMFVLVVERYDFDIPTVSAFNHKSMVVTSSSSNNKTVGKQRASSRNTLSKVSSDNSLSGLRDNKILLDINLHGNKSTADLGFRDDRSLAEDLKSKVRVLIWVMTHKPNLHVKAVHVRDTWARRADHVIYVSSHNDTDFPAVAFHIPEGPGHLTEKTMRAFRYIYEKHLDDADWFMKADDDTYVVVENLRYFLADKNPNEPVFFGQVFTHRRHGQFTSGGAGYVLSKEAVRRIGKSGQDPQLCDQSGNKEDVRLSLCLKNLGVRLGNSTDGDGRGTFFGIAPDALATGNVPSWYTHLGGGRNMSRHPVSFHWITPAMMHTLDYLLYHARPFGIQCDQRGGSHDSIE